MPGAGASALAGRRRRLVAALLLAIGALRVAGGLPLQPAVAATGVGQPRSIRELADSIDHTLKGLLTGEEQEMFATMSPEQIKSVRPQLYTRIRRDVWGWTEEWLTFVRQNVPPIPEADLREGEDLAHRVDGLLRAHFTARQWRYNTMRVVYLPAQVFVDKRGRGRTTLTGGMFMRFYPESFFANLDGPVPLSIVLVHESLHFNKRGTPWGVALTEAITETATRDLVVQLGLQTEADMRRNQAYTEERKGMDYLLKEMVRRSVPSREDALELLLAAYLSGNQKPVEAIFGTDAWNRVVALGESKQTWQTHRIARALSP